MNLHEYQSKILLKEYGIPVPEGVVVTGAEKAKKVAMRIGGDIFAVKAQILAGGRGKAGAIKIARSPQEAYEFAKSLLKKRIVTYQTGPDGLRVRKVLIEQGQKIKKEYYLAVLLDRSKEKICVVASRQGGVDIEEVARTHPEEIVTEYSEIFIGFPDYKARKIERFLGIPCADIVKKLVNLFIEKELSLCEINPLVQTEDGRVLALDAKMIVDDNALFRHPEIQKFYNPKDESPQEARARKIGISYVYIGGDVGCLVNGAGLAMATMDEILLAGGKPANFLDVGGGASLEQVRSAFSILLSDKNVKSVFVNIFGGIMRCDTVASALVQAAREMMIKVPVIVRLEGTNVEMGRKILEESGLNIITAESIREGAELAVRKAKEYEEIRKGRGRKRKEEKIAEVI